ncbi:MAG: 6-phosphogluconolactonase [Candidatus Methylopumilus sp.]|nr:6-phosphogluconolactonase [Candidatus Methylopumilus sp.]
MNLKRIKWQLFNSQISLDNTAKEHILGLAESSIKDRGVFHIVLAGGSTPMNVYSLLKTVKTDWHKWQIYFGDERCLDKDHQNRNSTMVFESWLSHIDMPLQNIYVIPAEEGPIKGAALYNETLSNLGDFDLVLLGLGEDAHTASLFPGHHWDDNLDVLAVFDAPKPPPSRVSLSPARLSRSKAVLFLISGKEKQTAMSQWQSGEAIPASTITCVNGIDIFYFNGN